MLDNKTCPETICACLCFDAFPRQSEQTGLLTHAAQLQLSRASQCYSASLVCYVTRLSALLAAPALQQSAQSSFHNVVTPPASRHFEVHIKSRLTWLASFTVMSQLTFGVQATGIHLPIFQQEHRVVSSTCHLLDISVVDEPIHLWFRNDDLEVATYPRLSIRRVAPAQHFLSFQQVIYPSWARETGERV